jgi:hypothetical protein
VFNQFAAYDKKVVGVFVLVRRFSYYAASFTFCLGRKKSL